MKDLKLHTPGGLNDWLPDTFRRKRALERRIESVFQHYGYAFVSSPALEYLAVFEEKGSLPPARMYKFIDKNGDMLTLRSDMTLPVARIAATNPALGLADDPVRLCYIEKTFRNHAHFQGKADEFTQAGVELMGVRSAAADAEVVAVAIESLQATGLDFQVDIGQVDFLQGVLAESGLDESQQCTLSVHMLQRDYVAVEKLVAEAGEQISDGARVILSDLTRWMGGLEMLRCVRSYVKHQKALEALAYLEEVYGWLSDHGLDQYVLFDLSMTGHLDYYTGMIFRGYARGIGTAVAGGGRYDRLLSAFGQPSPAVGFGIRLDDVMNALSSNSFLSDSETADTLLMYTVSGRSAALRAGDALRKQGVIIENSLYEDDLERNKLYATRRKMGGILFFTDADTVRLINLNTGEDNTVSVASLLEGGQLC